MRTPELRHVGVVVMNIPPTHNSTDLFWFNLRVPDKCARSHMLLLHKGSGSLGGAEAGISSGKTAGVHYEMVERCD